MRLVIIVFLFCLVVDSVSVYAAALAEAREVARNSNCPPKKIEVYQQTVGTGGKVIYSVECILPKTKEENTAQQAAVSSVLIQCDNSLCFLLRPVSERK